MSKRITFNEEARQGLLRGIRLAARAVSVTLGPRGRNVVVKENIGRVSVINDGMSIIKNIQLSDPLENAGARLLREVALETNGATGDGTTTSVVLTHALVEEGFKLIAAGANPVLLKQGLYRACQDAKESIKKFSTPVQDYAEVKRVATIAAGNDQTLGGLIAEALETIGKDGVITVEEGHGLETSLEIQEGMELPNGMVSPHLIPEGDSVTFENVRIMLTDWTLTNIVDMLDLFDSLIDHEESLLIIANDINGSALAAFIQNVKAGTFKVACVKAPDTFERKIGILEDLALVTGATVLRDVTGHAPKTVTRDHLGVARRITVYRNKTVIVTYPAAKKAIMERVKFLRKEIERQGSTFEKERLQSRLARLAGGVAVLTVGAATETELRDKKLRLEDALNATRTAIKEGIAPGAGQTYLEAAMDLQTGTTQLEHQEQPEDYQRGYNVLINALRAPLRTILQNAGVNAERIIGELESDKFDFGYGWNALTNQYENLLETGVLDSTGTLLTALDNAVSVAGLLFTGEAAIVLTGETEPEPIEY